MIYVIDLQQLSKETYCFLKQYFFTKQQHAQLSDAEFAYDLEYTFVKEVRQIIEKRIHPLIQGVKKHQYPYMDICKKYDLSYEQLVETIENLYSYNNIFNQIDKYVMPETFDCWVIEKKGHIYVLENLGDYRIMEWETDHVIDGKYVG